MNCNLSSLRGFCFRLACLGAFVSPVSDAKGDLLYEHHGANDPEDEGFRLRMFGSPGGTSTGPIADDQGYAAWSLSSDYASGYFTKNLEFEDRGEMLKDGFLLTMVARPIQGDAVPLSIIAGVSVRSDSRIFQLALSFEEDGDIAANVLDFATVTGLNAGYHTYSIAFDPLSQTADLFIDGVERLSGFSGTAAQPFAGGSVLDFAALNGGEVHFHSVRLESVAEASSIVLLGAAGIVGLGVRHWRRRPAA